MHHFFSPLQHQWPSLPQRNFVESRWRVAASSAIWVSGVGGVECGLEQLVRFASEHYVALGVDTEDSETPNAFRLKRMLWIFSSCRE
jgi:hypothetical protein